MPLMAMPRKRCVCKLVSMYHSALATLTLPRLS